MTLEFIGTCSDREIAQIAEKGSRRFSYKRLVKLIKEQYPDMYKALSLDSYNPWWEQSHRINYEGELYVNLIWSDIDHIFKIT